MTSAFYRSITDKTTNHTKWFPLSNQSLWTLLSAAGVASVDWHKGYTPMEVLELATSSFSVDWDNMHNYCVFSFYHFMKYCLENRIIVPRSIAVEGTTVSEPSVRLHFSWCTIFFKVYDV